MADERRQSIRLRKATNLGFSVPIVERNIIIYSGEAQSLLRHYNFTSDALYRLGNTLRRYAPEEQVLELQRHVFENLIDPLQEELTKLEANYNDMKLTEEEEKDVKFTKPYEDTVEISYPEARMLLDILLKYDKLLFRLAQLRFAGKIKESEYLQVGAECRNRIKGDEKQIERLVREAIKMAEAKAQELQEEEDFKQALEKSGAGDKERKAPGNGRGNGRSSRRKVTEDATSAGASGSGGDEESSKLPGSANEESFSPFAQSGEAPA